MIAINKCSSKLKNWSVEMPNAPYSKRWQTLKNKKDDKKITIEFCTIN
jgi:hypothetical protein